MKTMELTPLRKKYGVTERKKAEIDQLTIQVADARYNVEQQQAVVTSLTNKSQKCQGYLATATSNRAAALNNKTMLDETVSGINDLRQSSQSAFDKMALANAKTKDVAIGMKSLIDKLIYSAEVIDKLSNLVIRQKAMNPLISDELVAVITEAGKDANNAVSLTLVALKSTFVSQSGTQESEAAADLECLQSVQLLEVITGIDPNGDPKKVSETSLVSLMNKANNAAIDAYNKAEKANTVAMRELNKAISDLTKWQNKLKSLEAGLAAAKAAALAS